MIDYDTLTTVDSLDYIYIDWDLGNVCNFSCHYCPSSSHDGTRRFPSVEEAKQALSKFYSILDYLPEKNHLVVNLLGGEPTLWPGLEELARYNKELNPKNKLQLLTNGSRTDRWWHDNAHYIDKIILSIHSANIDIEDMVGKFNKVSDRIEIMYQFAMDIEIFDTCVGDYLYAIEHVNNNISVMAKPLRKTLGSNELMCYTDEQLRIMKLLPHFDRMTIRDQWVMTKNDNIVEYTHGQKLILNKQNSWKGWTCWVGIDSINIRNDGNIGIGSSCNSDIHVGSIYGEFNLPLKPIKCRYGVCSCMADIHTRKFKHYDGDTIQCI